MKGLVYYLSLPFIYFISILPFQLLYCFSDILYLLIYYLIGYRKRVVIQNLSNAFPQKNKEEIEAIRQKFYRYFCDMIVEIIKILTISPKQLKKRVSFNTSIYEKYQAQKQSIIVAAGHFGNWEMAGARASVANIPLLYVVYFTLSNPYFNRLAHRMRTRLGSNLYRMQDALRGIVKNCDKLTINVFVADQSPSPEYAYWTEFLNQDTPVFVGVEKIGKKMNFPIVYFAMKKLQRGFYQIESEILVPFPQNTKTYEITEAYIKRLEKDIIEQPEFWLWTHKRWKHRRAVQ